MLEKTSHRPAPPVRRPCVPPAQPPNGRRGRPARVPGELASERRWCFLTPSEDAALLAAATENDLTPAELIRDAINDYVGDYSDRKIFHHR